MSTESCSNNPETATGMYHTTDWGYEPSMYPSVEWCQLCQDPTDVHPCVACDEWMTHFGVNDTRRRTLLALPVCHDDTVEVITGDVDNPVVCPPIPLEMLDF